MGRAPHPFLKEELALASESPGLGRPRSSLEDQTSLASLRLLKEIGGDGSIYHYSGSPEERASLGVPTWEPENNSYTPSLGCDVRFHVEIKV